MTTRTLIAIPLLIGLTAPGLSQEPAPQEKPQATPADPAPARPIRNAPSPRALEFAAYIYSAANVCGYQIGVPAFEAMLAKQNAKAEDVSPRGPFANRLMTMFTMMSNQIQQNREEACLAVAGEYGPDGVVAKSVLLPVGAEPAPADGGAPSKPAR